MIGLMVAACGAWADSALRWERKVVETQVAPGEKTVRAEFPFTNTSKQPVTIDSVKSSCGCTTASLDKKNYLPGEKGQITAVFTPTSSRKGTQVKAIKVTVKGEPDPAYLTLVARVGEAVEFNPPLVFWRVAEAPKPKTIRVKVPAGTRLTGVTSSHPRMTVKLELVKEGAEYLVTVVPMGTNERLTSVLKLQGVTVANEPKEYQAYAQVK